MNRWLQGLLTGNIFSQEYLCLSENADFPSFSFLIRTKNESVKVSGRHYILGYKPVVLGFEAGSFSIQPPPGEIFIDVVYPPLKKTVARMRLSLLPFLADTPLHLYKVVEAHHHFTSPLQHLAQRFIDTRHRRQAGNIPIDRLQYDGVRIAYAVPRRISLVTVSDGSRFNLFPTDLHGRAGNKYVDSLRRDGLAAAQVQTIGKMVISHVRADAYNMAYGLGKNHMQQLQPPENFPFSENVSKTFGWPLPRFTLGYDELELAGFIDEGIHRIFSFRIVHSEPLQDASTLSHVHALSASWRKKHGATTHYLLRSPESPVKSGS